MEIKAARYFDGFQTKSQKEQLEFVSDSRKQIEELIGEVKSALTAQGNAIPDESKTILERHVEELTSEQLFTRLSGLKSLLAALVLFNADNKSISDFVERNQPYITEYLEKLMKVEVSFITKTLEEREAYQNEYRDARPGHIALSPAVLESPMFKPFIEYDRLLVECINKIAKNEKRGFFSEDLSFRDDELQDPSKWLLRARQSKNAAVWLLTFDMLVSFVKDIHDKRVAEAKTAYAKENTPAA